MLLIDKYRPKKINEIFFHKDLYGLLEVMCKDNAIPHLIFYGAEGSGKKTLINIFLEMIFDETVHKLKDVTYKVTGSGNKSTDEVIKQSSYHIVIEPKNNNSDRYLIHDIVKEYAKRRSLRIFKTNRNFKLIVINNIDNISYYAQTALRRTMEKYNGQCRFVMWCKSLSKVIKPLQSRCICLPVPCPTDLDLFQYLMKISFLENMKLSLDKCYDIIINANGNIKKVLWELQLLKFNYSNITSHDEIIREIVNIMISGKLDNFKNVREHFHKLMITNFDGVSIIRDILNTICTINCLSDDIKQKIVYIGSKTDYKMVKGRREIIQFDDFIISVLKIINSQQ
jgi:replication factor C subunit 3/5